MLSQSYTILHLSAGSIPPIKQVVGLLTVGRHNALFHLVFRSLWGALHLTCRAVSVSSDLHFSHIHSPRENKNAAREQSHSLVGLDAMAGILAFGAFIFLRKNEHLISLQISHTIGFFG